VSSTGPGKEESKHPLELLKVNAILFKVRQAGVVPVQRIAAPTPVAAGEMLCLKKESTGGLLGMRSQSKDQEEKGPA